MTLISSELLPASPREKSDLQPTTSGERLTIGGKFFQCGARRARLKGITYGPFIPDACGDPFPAANVARRDLAQMELVGINALRTYHVPPEWFLDLVGRERDMRLLIDVPWSKHLCFLDSQRDCQEAREAVRGAASRCGRHGCVLGYSIGNEIPPDIVRWHGARRVERFLAELMDVAKQADSAGLVTFANYPPTEYLDLSFLDFATFNVYLHNHETFRRYLLRLQNLVGDLPLVLGELGMDSLRHGQQDQANMLAGHVQETLRVGLAGAFVFSWTDEWYTGKHEVRDWAFGITEADRSAKAAYYALRETHETTLVESLAATPRVSSIVCSFNGGAMLAQCLESLCQVDYPDHEVILVDDGSTDNTREIAARFPLVRAIHQSNQGLSMARNAGLQAATGEIIAYTDSDCIVDHEWLAHLVAQLIATGAAAVGGPNLAPEDGSLAACVEASPGQPTHVLESDQVAEHVPGCNMAFRRDALLSINGFDPQFRQAGDDVDICWRLQQAGHWITFAPSAFVWHHRRKTPRAYLKQQAGYGRAEALLRFKHPHRFNARGQGIWRGVVYGAGQQPLPFDGAIIYRGTFGTGLFQCIYRRGPAHWAMIPSTLEWQTVACALVPIAVAWWPIAIVSAVMLLLSLFVASLQAVLANIRPGHEGARARLLIMALCYAQPLVRSWARFHMRYFAHRASDMQALDYCGRRLRPLGRYFASYWGTGAPERTMLLQQVIASLKQRRCGTTVDTGWLESDLEIFSNPLSLVQVCTAQEDLGAGERVIRVRYQLRLTRITWLLALFGVLGGGLATRWQPFIAGLIITATLIGLTAIWYRGLRLAAKIVLVFDDLAIGMGLVRCTRNSAGLESTETLMMHLEPCSAEAAS